MEEKTITSVINICQPEELSQTEQELISMAIKATDNSYVPYSRFHVGCAVLLENSVKIVGCNQENASFPVTICAERSALFAAGAQYPDTPVACIAIAARNGDGLLAALQILRIMREKEKPLSELARQLQLFPQKLINVRVEKKLPFEERPAIGKAVAEVERALAGRGRVLLRYSGTEALCRVMVEAEDEKKVVRYATELAEIVNRELR